MFNAAEEMSPLERAFVKEYALALLRDADFVQCVVGLMEPDGLAITDVAVAAAAATKLCEISDDYTAKMTAVAEKSQLPAKKTRKFDQAQEKILLDVFGLSFFKLAVKDETSFVKKKYDAGWFSGKPTEWSNLLNKAYGGLSKPVDDKKSPPSMLDLFSQLFNAFLPKNLPGNKLWPPTPTLFLYYDEYYADDDMDEEEEDEDDDYEY